MTTHFKESFSPTMTRDIEKEDITDANMERFFMYVWGDDETGEHSKSQIKKAQMFFKAMRMRFGLKDPQHHGHLWPNYVKYLSLIQKKKEWKKPQTHKFTLDATQDEEITSGMKAEMVEWAEDDKVNWKCLRGF
jgi:hypothetical protein